MSKSKTPLRRVGRVSHVDGGQSQDLTLGPKRGERSSAGVAGERREGGGGKKTHSSTPTVFLPSQNGQLKVVGTFFCFFFSGGGAEDFRFPMAVPWRPPSQSRLPNSPGWLRSARFGFQLFFFQRGSALHDVVGDGVVVVGGYRIQEYERNGSKGRAQLSLTVAAPRWCPACLNASTRPCRSPP